MQTALVCSREQNRVESARHFLWWEDRPTLGFEMVLKQVTIRALRDDGTPWESAEHAGIGSDP